MLQPAPKRTLAATFGKSEIRPTNWTRAPEGDYFVSEDGAITVLPPKINTDNREIQTR